MNNLVKDREERKITREEFQQGVPEALSSWIEDGDKMGASAMAVSIVALTSMSFAKHLENYLFGEEED